jgi:hypothetical protein
MAFATTLHSRTAPAAPHAFSLFAQNPRDNHDTIASLIHVFRPSKAPETGTSSKGIAGAFWKLFGDV